MNYTITLTNAQHDFLTRHLFKDRTLEQAAYLLCGVSNTTDENRLLVREVIPVLPDEISEHSDSSMLIKPISYIRAIKKARMSKSCFVFIHSHPLGMLKYSSQDDLTEQKLFSLAHERIPTAPIHASLLFTEPRKWQGRVWLADGRNDQINLLRIIGRRFEFQFNHDGTDDIPQYFDRQVRAFGSDIQKVLGNIRVGVVGVGGTGSSVLEQLARLGVNDILISDNDGFDVTNVNRLYGSRLVDKDIPKVDIAQRHIQEIGLGTNIKIINKPITYESVAREFCGCDVIFCCTDDHWGRSILNSISVYYHIPVFDMGVKIKSSEGIIESVQGRVTTLIPESACLLCRGRITPKSIADETRAMLDPDLAEQWRRDGYAPEITETRAPAVITFTTGIASAAVSELLHRLTGFMGEDRLSTEVIYRFDESRLRTNSTASKEDCSCMIQGHRGQGDKKTFLDMMWVR